ncbi:TrkA family potassium uptake protein [Actinoplanes sp. KI2]|uniref:potassium channel family protein n=1 Tax=Actinoplanes sp. KI2 TaxID=2983315 RepID=UPI0021D5C3A0|nr:TrkA family potassium uptake protein [Actinoplanes sp. KI2]MCU7729455.1 TrkA family potassium uptake protein [Actinoplanes sp. KI2]
MKVIIMGCGRVGAELAQDLCAEHHDVTVIDRTPNAAERLPATFPGRFLLGNGYNQRLLEDAGITQADGFIAVTSGDNTNIVGARIAKEDYRVPLVVARIYDPRRADIYRDLGMTTVASVRWTVNRIHQLLTHRNLTTEMSFGNGETVLVRQQLPAWLAGRPLNDLEVDGEIRVIDVTRAGRSSLASRNTVIEAGDEITFAVAATALDRLRDFLGKELGT